tara:strand:- start:20 stop:358 length:339 start_codon:yes stop_codon:yes gene_type:complete
MYRKSDGIYGKEEQLKTRNIPHTATRLGATGLNKSQGLGIAGMICGICGLCISWFPPVGLPVSIVGTVLSGIQREKIWRGEGHGDGFVAAGSATGILGIVISVVVLLIWISV